jgi:D-alanyl-D-alanine carboxypeptidase
MSPRHQLRIASISKAVTGVAILKLVEAGQLSLDNAVFGKGAILGTKYGSQPYDSRLKRITVRHLLTHTSGWLDGKNDPMFMENLKTHKAVIDYMIDERGGLVTVPGTTYDYLNFGFSALGRVIETASGMNYEDYVRTRVLAPGGISRMRIGNNSESEKLSNEVTYEGSKAYQMRLRHMDAHGEWVASAVDLVKLAVHVDGLGSPTDILSANSRSQLLMGTQANPEYALGWKLGSGQGHNGTLPGTSGYLWQTANGYSFAILANSRNTDTDKWVGKARSAMFEILGAATKWPSYDLFKGTHKPVGSFTAGSGGTVSAGNNIQFSAGIASVESVVSGGLENERSIPVPAVSPRPGKPVVTNIKMRRQIIGARVFEIVVSTVPGSRYDLQASSDLGTWETVKSFMGNGSEMTVGQQISPASANPQISYGGVGTNITANFCGRFIDSPPLFPL